MRKILAAIVLLSAAAPALAQSATPEAAALAYALKRICGWHVEGTSGVDLFKSENKINGWTERNVGERISYDKTGDWGSVKVMYGSTDTQSRCSVSVNPSDTATLDTDAMHAAVRSFVAERFPKAALEKDRAPSAANGQLRETRWTDGLFSVRLGEIPVAGRKPVVQVYWDRDLY